VRNNDEIKYRKRQLIRESFINSVKEQQTTTTEDRNTISFHTVSSLLRVTVKQARHYRDAYISMYQCFTWQRWITLVDKTEQRPTPALPTRSWLLSSLQNIPTMSYCASKLHQQINSLVLTTWNGQNFNVEVFVQSPYGRCFRVS